MSAPVFDPDCEGGERCTCWVNAPDEVCPPCDELRVIRDAFRAGAEYMRRSTSARVEPPGPHWARITAPDAERVDAAAAGYVEGLVG